MFCFLILLPVSSARGSKRLRQSIFLILSAASLISGLAFFKLSIWARIQLDLFYDSLWRGYLWWVILMTPVATFYFLRERRVELVRPMIIATFCGCIVAAAFPWPTHIYVVAIIVIFYSAFFNFVSRNRELTFGYWILGLSIFFIFDYQKNLQTPIYDFEVDHARFHGQIAADAKPYIELAEKISQLPQNESVYAFPNLAFSLFLSNREPADHTWKLSRQFG